MRSWESNGFMNPPASDLVASLEVMAIMIHSMLIPLPVMAVK